MGRRRPGNSPRSGIAHYASAMAYEKITFSAAPSGVATIALDEPDTRNALSDDLLAELIERSRHAAMTTPCAAWC